MEVSSACIKADFSGTERFVIRRHLIEQCLVTVFSGRHIKMVLSQYSALIESVLFVPCKRRF